VKATFIRCFHLYQLGVTPRFQYTHLTKEIARKVAKRARADLVAMRDARAMSFAGRIRRVW